MNFYDIFAVIAILFLATVFVYFLYWLNKFLNEFAAKLSKLLNESFIKNYRERQ